MTIFYKIQKTELSLCGIRCIQFASIFLKLCQKLAWNLYIQYFYLQCMSGQKSSNEVQGTL